MFLLGVRLVRSKALVFEISIISSNLIPPAIYADVIQLVECLLAKQNAVGSSPIVRSILTFIQNSSIIGAMMKVKETIEKAYGNVPKEVGFSVDLSFLPTMRGFKYYFLILIRKITR